MSTLNQSEDDNQLLHSVLSGSLVANDKAGRRMPKAGEMSAGGGGGGGEEESTLSPVPPYEEIDSSRSLSYQHQHDHEEDDRPQRPQARTHATGSGNGLIPIDSELNDAADTAPAPALPPRHAPASSSSSHSQVIPRSTPYYNSPDDVVASSSLKASPSPMPTGSDPSLYPRPLQGTPTTPNIAAPGLHSFSPSSAAPSTPQPQQQQPPTPTPQQQPPPPPAPASTEADGKLTFHTALPLYALQRDPAPVDCPRCRQRNLTRLSYSASTATHVWAATAGVVTLGVALAVPYLMKGTKDVVHACPNCKAKLATVLHSGRTEVHCHA